MPPRHYAVAAKKPPQSRFHFCGLADTNLHWPSNEAKPFALFV